MEDPEVGEIHHEEVKNSVIWQHQFWHTMYLAEWLTARWVLLLLQNLYSWSKIE